MLVIEVADTSLHHDCNVKIPLYAQHGISEVWLIDIEKRQLAIYRQPDGDVYRAIIHPAPLAETTLSALPELCVDLSGLLCRCPACAVEFS